MVRWLKKLENNQRNLNVHVVAIEDSLIYRLLRRMGRPLLSLTLPVRNPRREWLEQAVQSVLDQTYSHWKLCVCINASSDDWVREYFAGLAGADPRLRIMHSAEALGAAEALKRSCSLAKGTISSS